MTKKSRRRKPTSTLAGRQILAALTEAVESARRGERPQDRFTVRTIDGRKS